MSSRIAVVSLSGGMDSATLLSWILGRKFAPRYSRVVAVQFIYPSKHNEWEIKAVDRLMDSGSYENVELVRMEVNVFDSMESHLLKSGAAIPEGHYEDSNMKQTVVPGRNMIFASILSSLAWSWNRHGNSRVYLGVHSGDHAIYPDCRPRFISHMARTAHYATDGHVGVRAPFLCYNKTDILKIGHRLGTPYQYTRTCYKDQEKPCGKCGACTERLEAFREIGLDDPVMAV